jgi:hypothetical protein
MKQNKQKKLVLDTVTIKRLAEVTGGGMPAATYGCPPSTNKGGY